MDIFSLLGYLNKFSLFAFVVTLAVLGYQVFAIRRNKSNKTVKNPNIPDFDEKKTVVVPSINYTKIDTVKLFKRETNNKSLIILIIITVVVMFILLFSLFTKSNNSLGSTSAANVQFVISTGIKIYDLNWHELTAIQEYSLNSGDSIIIGIAKTADSTVDRARIRVNKSGWTAEDETAALKQDKNVYYKDFTVATGESTLRIDAELHSTRDGWLGE